MRQIITAECIMGLILPDGATRKKNKIKEEPYQSRKPMSACWRVTVPLHVVEVLSRTELRDSVIKMPSNGLERW